MRVARKKKKKKERHVPMQAALTAGMPFNQGCCEKKKKRKDAASLLHWQSHKGPQEKKIGEG